MDGSTPKNWHNENGFEFALFPQKTEKAEGLVIYMHGIGDNAQGFGYVAEMIQEKMPGAAVIALQGPLEIHHPDLGDQKGYGWFPYGGKVLPQIGTWLKHIFNRLTVATQVEKFAHTQLEKLGLTEKNLAYVGNSMGAIVAVEAGLSKRNAAAAVVSRGGSVAPFTKIRNKNAEVFLQIGQWDEIFNDDAPERDPKLLKRVFNAVADKFSLRHGRSMERLAKKHVTTTEKTYTMQGHMLDSDAWQDSADFIAKALQKNAPKPAAG